jgi:hypothetical protein
VLALVGRDADAETQVSLARNHNRASLCCA